MNSHTYDVGAEIIQERRRQDLKWGEQNHPSGTGSFYKRKAALAKKRCQNPLNDQDSWDLILLEEVYEALAETNELKVREELIQVAAVAMAWVECIDRRNTQ